MQQTPPHIVLLIIATLAGGGILGMIGTFFLILYKADPAHIALFSAILSNTRSVPTPSTTTQTTTTKTDPPPPET